MQCKLILLGLVAAFALTASANPDSANSDLADFDDFDDAEFDDADYNEGYIAARTAPGINPINGLPVPRVKPGHHKHYKGKHHDKDHKAAETIEHILGDIGAHQHKHHKHHHKHKYNPFPHGKWYKIGKGGKHVPVEN